MILGENTFSVFVKKRKWAWGNTSRISTGIKDVFQKENMSNLRDNQMPLWLGAFGRISKRVVAGLSTIKLARIVLSVGSYMTTRNTVL